jgi:hypothetical protein
MLRFGSTRVDLSGGTPAKTPTQEKVTESQGRSHAVVYRRIRRFRGSGCQPSLTRAKPSQASMATPKRRRKRFTPRSTSSPAHSARAAEARTTRTACTQPWGPQPHHRRREQPHRERPVGELGQRDPAGRTASNPVHIPRAILCQLRRSQGRTPAGRCPIATATGLLITK